MTDQEIDTKLKEMIVDRLFLRMKPGDIDSSASLIDVYGVDSVCLLELVVGLEEEFGITVDDGDFSVKNFETVDSIAAFVRARQ